jgi:hypothetical protein
VRGQLERWGIRRSIKACSDRNIAAALAILDQGIERADAEKAFKAESRAVKDFERDIVRLRAEQGVEPRGAAEGSEYGRMEEQMDVDCTDSHATPRVDELRTFHANPRVQEAALAFEEGELMHTVDKCHVCSEVRPVFHATEPLGFDRDARVGESTLLSVNPWHVRPDVMAGSELGRAGGAGEPPLAICDRCLASRTERRKKSQQWGTSLGALWWHFSRARAKKKGTSLVCV